jgi:hypothetical protein
MSQRMTTPLRSTTSTVVTAPRALGAGGLQHYNLDGQKRGRRFGVRNRGALPRLVEVKLERRDRQLMLRDELLLRESAAFELRNQLQPLVSAESFHRPRRISRLHPLARRPSSDGYSFAVIVLGISSSLAIRRLQAGSFVHASDGIAIGRTLTLLAVAMAFTSAS